MDPTEAVAMIRGLIEEAARTNDHVRELLVLREAAELFEGLDTWLCKDGFQPEQWRQPRRIEDVELPAHDSGLRVPRAEDGVPTAPPEEDGDSLRPRVCHRNGGVAHD